MEADAEYDAEHDHVRRFQVEAQAAANLQHPNIVSIHEVGQHEGWHYFSMDYVEGRDLTLILRENVLPAKRAAKRAATIVETMAKAIRPFPAARSRPLAGTGGVLSD